MSISWQDVINLAPELAGVPTLAQEAILQQVFVQVQSTAWASKALYAQALLAAHYATLGRKNGAAGSLTAERAGEVSRGFGAPANATRHSSTSYGADFDELARSIASFRFAVTGATGA